MLESKHQYMLDQVQELKRALEEEKENNGENIEMLSNALRIAQSDLAAIDAQREELLVVIRQLNMEIRTYKDKKDELQALTEQNALLRQEYEASRQQIAELQAEKDELNKQLIEINKPFATQLGQFLAKVINLILNAIKKKK